MSYHPEPYWNVVAGNIAQRSGSNIIAGDDEPYYRYKRQKFLTLLNRLSFGNKKVLEIGPGPGGNIAEVLHHNPREVHGADISSNMLEMAQSRINDPRATFTKIDGVRIPYENEQFDISFTSTVLQHNTDEKMLKALCAEICRVTRHEVVLFEKIEKQIKGTELCLGRPVSYYEGLMKAHGFELMEQEFLNIPVSYMICGAVRRLFTRAGRHEGEPLPRLAHLIQKISLPLTSRLDKLFPSSREVAMLRFSRMTRLDRAQPAEIRRPARMSQAI